MGLAIKITTQKQVDGSLPARLHGCGQNFYLDVRSATSRSWLFIWKVNGRQHSEGFGSATGAKGAKITLVEARKKADRFRTFTPMVSTRDGRQQRRP